MLPAIILVAPALFTRAPFGAEKHVDEQFWPKPTASALKPQHAACRRLRWLGFRILLDEPLAPQSSAINRRRFHGS